MARERKVFPSSNFPAPHTGYSTAGPLMLYSPLPWLILLCTLAHPCLMFCLKEDFSHVRSGPSHSLWYDCLYKFPWHASISETLGRRASMCLCQGCSLTRLRKNPHSEACQLRYYFIKHFQKLNINFSHLLYNCFNMLFNF